MIHSIYIIYSNGLLLFEKQFTPQSKLLSKDKVAVAGFINALFTFASQLGQRRIESMSFDKYKFICGLFEPICVVFYIDKADDEYKLREKIKRVGETFLLKYNQILQDWNGDLSIFQDFEIDNVIRSTIKVVFLGLPGVGKTTLCNLINGNPITLDYTPTIGFGLSDLMISGDCQVSVWDVAGQEQYRPTWKDILEEADIVFLVTDSQKENVYKTLDLYRINKKYAEESTSFYIIANKQDLPNSLTPQDIQQIFHLPTYNMVAINPKNRKKMLTILREKVGEKIGQQLTIVESKLSGKEQIFSILTSIEQLKTSLIKILELDDPIFQTMNFWIDKLKYYQSSSLSETDYNTLMNELETWKKLAARTVSQYVSEEKVLQLIEEIDNQQKIEASQTAQAITKASSSNLQLNREDSSERRKSKKSKKQIEDEQKEILKQIEKYDRL